MIEMINIYLRKKHIFLDKRIIIELSNKEDCLWILFYQEF